MTNTQNIIGNIYFLFSEKIEGEKYELCERCEVAESIDLLDKNGLCHVCHDDMIG